jgi:hypothetical protein
MKNVILFVVFFLTYLVFPQSPPQGISHRGTAYRIDGTLIVSSEIQINVSILNDNSTVVFFETHSLISTNSQGQYSLIIGSVETVTFNTIDWGSPNSKWLKVEIFPPLGQGSTPLVGENQLMSVPYALYSLSSNNASNGITMVKNIQDLKNIPVQVPVDDNKVVYIKGYYEEGDGGEGFFIFKDDENVPDTGGIYIKPNIITPTPVNDTGRWVRQYSGPINVMYFGVVKYPQYFPPYAGPQGDQTNGVRINNAIEYVNRYNLGYLYGNPLLIQATKTPKDMTIYFPSGAYHIDREIILYSNINIKGDKGTRLFPTFGGTNKYLFNISTGFIQKLNIESIEIDFTESLSGLGGIHLKAVNNPSVADGGGAWASNFRNLKMFKPTGHGIYLEGEDRVDTVKAWNQYLHFEDIFIERENLGKNNNCLKISGANVNIQFESCFFQIPYTLESSVSDAGANVYISSSGILPQYKPSQISFINCASGGGNAQGVYNSFIIDNSENITLENCWFEDVEVAIDINESKGINILNSRFANAAGLGGLNNPLLPEFGTCIFIRNSIVNVERNYVLVSNPNLNQIKNHRFIRAIGDSNTVNVRNNSFSDIRLSETFGIVQETYIKNIVNYNTYPSNQQLPGIETGEMKVVLVKIDENGLNKIDRINSSINAGETLFIRAENGDIRINEWNPINETQGRNIYLSGNGTRSIILRHGQGALFIKVDGVNGIEKCAYQLISVTN